MVDQPATPTHTPTSLSPHPFLLLLTGVVRANVLRQEGRRNLVVVVRDEDNRLRLVHRQHRGPRIRHKQRATQAVDISEVGRVIMVPEGAGRVGDEVVQVGGGRRLRNVGAGADGRGSQAPA